MKTIKMFGLAALLGLSAMAFAGTSAAMAEGGMFCDTDPGTGSSEVCPSGHEIEEVHLETVGKAKLLSNITVECFHEFVGVLVGSMGAWMLYVGTWTLYSCGACTMEETGGESTIGLRKLGHETGELTFEGSVFVECGAFLECEYDGEGLVGTVKGPLLSTQKNGEISVQNQMLHKTGGGFFCPKEAKLDMTLTTPLGAAYITE